MEESYLNPFCCGAVNLHLAPAAHTSIMLLRIGIGIVSKFFSRNNNKTNKHGYFHQDFFLTCILTSSRNPSAALYTFDDVFLVVLTILTCSRKT